MTEPEEFMGELVKRFRSCGVAFVYLPYMKNLEIYGAAKWLSPEKAMIVVTNRGKQADVFWFALLHEAGHLLNGSRRDPSVSCDAEEIESDSFARGYILSDGEFGDFMLDGRYTSEDIKRFAEEKGFSPCLLEGRLKHDGFLGHYQRELSIQYEYESLQKAYVKALAGDSRLS